MQIVQGLWDSYEDDAFPRDKERGIFLDKTRQHALNHTGEFFSVAGPLNISRSRQGQPVIFQAGVSAEGRDLAATIAEGIFTTADGFDEAREYYGDIKRRVAAAGRDPAHTLIFPGLFAIVADSDAEAKDREEAELGKLDLAKALVQLGRPFNYHDFSRYALDEPFPDLGELGSNGYRGHAERIKRVARQEKLTLRQAAWRFAASRSPFVGSPTTVANEIERWFLEGAADGFNVRLGNPQDFAAFTSKVLPILRQRGLFRLEYEHDTLRGNLGLPVPTNRHTLARQSPQAPEERAPPRGAAPAARESSPAA